MFSRPSLILAVVFVCATACGGATSVSAAPTTAAAGPTSADPARSRSAEPLPEGYDPARNPKADIAAALTKAKSNGRPVLLDFGADWCPDCVVLGRLFRSRTVRPVIGGFHVVQVDVGRFDRNLGVASRYRLNLKTSGIPALVVLSPEGRIRTTTGDGSFANARTMTAGQVAAFLKRWR